MYAELFFSNRSGSFEYAPGIDSGMQCVSHTAVCRALLKECRALLNVCRALLNICGALSNR